MSTGILFDGGKSFITVKIDFLEQGIQTKTQTNFNDVKTKPKLVKKHISFQKPKKNLDYFSIIKTIRNPNDIISNTEVILSLKSNFPNKLYNEISPYPPIKPTQKVYKTHRVKQMSIETEERPINNEQFYIDNYLTFRASHCKIGNTIYTELTKRKNE